MKTANIISSYQSILALEKNNLDKIKNNRMLDLSIYEARTLQQFCKMLAEQGLSSFEIFDGYFIGYSIKQISKEFDLLRFSEDLVVNIELKSELKLNDTEKINKIKTQMDQNYYYLKSLCRTVLVYTYIENDGLYMYDAINKKVKKISYEKIIRTLSSQYVNYSINPDNLFVPSTYLISPFNNTKRFIKEEYFLNNSQQEIKKEILKSTEKGVQKFYCISANAGTGKTLLMYDIVKTIYKKAKSPIIIHCGKLNPGHYKLISEYGWKIVPVSEINHLIDRVITQNINIIFIDESQRISDFQLNIIIIRANELNITIVFSYDKKQYLKSGESKDIHEYLTQCFPEILAVKRTLTNKIRTNKEMASFIHNLFEIGKSNSDLDYENITISYFDNIEIIKQYIRYICENRGFKAITFSDSLRNNEPISYIANICDSNAHDVIGQEFDKVVFIMDKNFQYGENRTLQASKTYYSIEGMLYQIVTRVVNELEIIVLNNPDLYLRLLEIKALGKDKN